MKKTEKSMAELQIELNLNHNWGAILEDGVALVDCYAPGRVGLKNLGNSCYMNACLQTLMSLKEFSNLKNSADDCFRNSKSPSEDLLLQLSKLATGLHSDRYLKEADVIRSTMEKPYNMEEGEFRKKLQQEEIFISPMAIKSLVGKGHADFSTSLQQDASEYLAHLLNLLEKDAKDNGNNRDDLSKYFTFEAEERIQMTSGEHNGKVSYKNVPDNILSLAIPLSAVDNLEEVETSKKKQKVEGDSEANGKESVEKILPNVPFQALLDQFNLGEKVNIRNAQATKSTRISKFSKYLWIKINRVVVNQQWQQEKLDHTIFLPDRLDLTSIKGNGKLDSEVELPEDESGGNNNNTASTATVPDASIVSQIAAMGFSENAGKRAAVATQNAGVEPAMNWVLAHMSDADINDPLPAGDDNANSGSSANAGGDPALIAQICSMGFSTEHAKFALKKNNNNGDVAVMWLFENSATVDAMIASEAALSTTSTDGSDDAENAELKSYSGKYKLKAFISHVGSNTNSGHYVCHVKDDNGKWIIFNDRKVSWSIKTPLQHGFMYLYVTED